MEDPDFPTFIYQTWKRTHFQGFLQAGMASGLYQIKNFLEFDFSRVAFCKNTQILTLELLGLSIRQKSHETKSHKHLILAGVPHMWNYEIMKFQNCGCKPVHPPFRACFLSLWAEYQNSTPIVFLPRPPVFEKVWHNLPATKPRGERDFCETHFSGSRPDSEGPRVQVMCPKITCKGVRHP